MKITVHEAFILAQKSLPTDINYELVLFGDEMLNYRAILAIADKKPYGLNALNLINLGLANSYDGAMKLVEKARKAVDKKNKV